MTEKQLKIPHVYQSTDFHCGPAVLQMVLEFYEITASQEELALQLNSSETDGSKTSDMERVAKDYGLVVSTQQNGTIDHLRQWIDQGIPVIVDFREPKWDEGHYAVVSGYNGVELLLHDPTHGPHFRINSEDFLKRWEGYPEPVKKWFMVVWPPDKHLKK